MSYYFIETSFCIYTINTVLSILISFPSSNNINSFFYKLQLKLDLTNFFSQFTLNNFFSIWDLEIRTNKNTYKQSLLKIV